MAKFEILFSEGDTNGLFSLFASRDGIENSAKLGEMTFSKVENTTWIIDHIGVDDAIKGTGAAAALVKHGVELFRERGIKIIPRCSYAIAQFKRYPQYRDVLHG